MEEKMSANFLQIKNQVKQDISNIYNDINIQLNRIDSNDIVSTLIRLETEKINIYITNLISKVRIATIEELKERKYPEYLTAGAWTKIIKSVSMPKIKLCSIQQINNVEYSNNTQEHHKVSKDLKSQEQIKLFKHRKITSICTTGVGGIAIIAALVIPGWEALPIALLCAGGIIIICGSASAINTHRKIETIKSRMEKEQMGTKSQTSAAALVNKLTDFQAKNNTKVILDWMEKIEEAIDSLCNTCND